MNPQFQTQAIERNLVTGEDVLPSFLAWRRMGLKCALVTLVNIEGGSPRALGSMMAVSSEGHYVGYLSGGCLESAVAMEAQLCIRDGQNKLVRYGRGSPYFDVQLPCGSGIDVFIDQAPDDRIIERLMEANRNREFVSHVTNLETGESQVDRLPGALEIASQRDGPFFRRTVIPTVKVHLIGAGPSMAAIAHLLSSIGFILDIATPDQSTYRDIQSFGLPARQMSDPSHAIDTNVDAWSAAILIFHDHHWEIPVIQTLLHSACFYVGVLGSNAVAAKRIAELHNAGVSPESLARIRAPIGLIPATKSRLSLAVSVVSELVSEAKLRGFVL
ncbi:MULTISPECIES: XdhC family protein [unclassified Hyphomicrobium]|uniref:XdhC family protein n=1 Tax=unclassified Hyphomicrobium TaxID=2619925 RepID=UPI0002E81832|nr:MULTISPECIES: XdhC family protein [unclassified Hyphomicrobium]